jgi:para-nitrobenzyl esterase
VRGYTRNGIYTFKGMPYADTTAGQNRFMPPVKPTPWTGIRSALALGPVCPQAYTSTFDSPRFGWRHDEEAFMFEWDDGHPGEDCLRVNVWTPSINDNKKRPVMVWIHGGGFTSGSSDELKAYDGENLSRRGDVVVVSLNHRLGSLGYLNLMEHSDKWVSSPNVGMLDLVAALEWVRDNIGNFGGDSGKVMIFGQSGGGSKVSTLMAMPSAKGLFHRASIQSGSSLRQIDAADSAKTAALLLQELGLSRANLDRIQELPNEQIVQAAQNAARKLQAAGGGRGAAGPGGAMRWGPTVDGKILPRHPFDPDGPAVSADVPMMVGTVLNEQNNSIQQGDPSLDEMSLDEVRKRLTAQRGDRANAIIEVFQKGHPRATPYELFSRINGAASRQNAITQAERKATQKAAPAFNYWFVWQTPVLDGRPRAFHCSELSFCFYNAHDRCAPLTGGGPDARALAAKVADAWINFARNGDPNHAGIPKWPAFTAAECPTMIFDNTCAMRNDPDRAERDSLRA